VPELAIHSVHVHVEMIEVAIRRGWTGSGRQQAAQRLPRPPGTGVKVSMPEGSVRAADEHILLVTL
jgi:hypothetical protein